jgi:hypothetical protein
VDPKARLYATNYVFNVSLSRCHPETTIYGAFGFLITLNNHSDPNVPNLVGREAGELIYQAPSDHFVGILLERKNMKSIK